MPAHVCAGKMQAVCRNPPAAGRLYGLDACSARGLLICGDTRGCLHLGDARDRRPVGRHQVHKKGNKARIDISGSCLPSRWIAGL